MIQLPVIPHAQRRFKRGDSLLHWDRELPPRWDASKKRILDAAPRGLFPGLEALQLGARPPGHWWRVALDGFTVGYGWIRMERSSGRFGLAVDPEHRGGGIGNLILDLLSDEGGRMGLWCLFTEPPKSAELDRWLRKRGFAPFATSGTLQRPIRSLRFSAAHAEMG